MGTKLSMTKNMHMGNNRAVVQRGGGVLTPKNPKKTRSQFTDFGVATGIFWDFLGFLGLFGIFWVFFGFLGFFWLEISDALKFGKQLFVGNPCIQ